MELVNFLRETQANIRSEIDDRLGTSEYPYPESVFAEVVMRHMAEIGMTFDQHVVCHYAAKVGNANLRLSGYAISDDAEQLDLFVSLYEETNDIVSIPNSQIKTAAEQCIRFLARCAQGRLTKTMEESNDAYGFAYTIQESYSKLDQIRIYVLTDGQTKAKNFKSREIYGKLVKLEVMDIERLYRHLSEGKPRDELVVNFQEVVGDALPCVYIPGEMEEYDYALTVMPGEALRFMYERYGARLLEANVRSFLGMGGKVNRGIRDTLNSSPHRFMAYNNGIVIVADELNLGKTNNGGPGILWMKGMQIVNGGQTTAAIYFLKRKNPDINLTQVRIPVKVIVLKSTSPVEEEILIADISKFSNSQNSIRQSDLSANKPFHIEMESLATSTYCPDGVGRWFYERTSGSYKTMLDREGTTPAKLRNLKQAIPFARKIIKTDLAKFIHAWDQYPHLVSLGAQKNFAYFMDRIGDEDEEHPSIDIPDVTGFKIMIAKAILFKAAQKLIRYKFSAFQANITTYTISLLSNRLGDRVDLERIWLEQNISPELREQIEIWAHEVDKILYKTSKGRMISEWAKKPECWTAVRSARYSNPLEDIPEIQ